MQDDLIEEPELCGRVALQVVIHGFYPWAEYEGMGNLVPVEELSDWVCHTTYDDTTPMTIRPFIEHTPSLGQRLFEELFFRGKRWEYIPLDRSEVEK